MNHELYDFVVAGGMSTMRLQLQVYERWWNPQTSKPEEHPNTVTHGQHTCKQILVVDPQRSGLSISNVFLLSSWFFHGFQLETFA